MTYEQLRASAEEFLARYHPSRNLPIPIEQIIESDFELSLIPIPNLLREFKTDGFLAGNMTEISIDEQTYLNSPRRARFTLAHELSHLILHKSIFEGKMRSIDQYKNFVESLDEKTYRGIEWQAASLGGLILVPGAELKQEFERGLALARKHGFDPVSTGELAVSYICDWISDKFDVSAQVISYRLNADKLMATTAPPDSTY